VTGHANGHQRLLIITPAHNESGHLASTASAVAGQTRPPDLWLVANDGSDDGTLEIARDLEREIPFLRVVDVEQPHLTAGDRLALALEARAFNAALRGVRWEDFTHLGKLDGDIELPRDYFENVLRAFSDDPRLGIFGGSIVEPCGGSGNWKRVTAPSYHVHGALKHYSRECFAAIDGISERLGWDTIDETYARMRGFRTFRDPALVARHHRPSASAGGKLRGRARHGECAYIARYSAWWVALRSLKMAVRWDPRGLSGLAFLWGFLSAHLRGHSRVEDAEFQRFVRAELRGRLRGALLGRALARG
jgi:GT2 family glycosyltransferase